mmetsp:Transcript_122205/g.353344  ORF Transcript_122205/g.353344 Transcript_122205/m.353344 type:complete len:271 (+) Transcript_122205:273-1085(+)
MSQPDLRTSAGATCKRRSPRPSWNRELARSPSTSHPAAGTADTEPEACSPTARCGGCLVWRRQSSPRRGELTARHEGGQRRPRACRVSAANGPSLSSARSARHRSSPCAWGSVRRSLLHCSRFRWTQARTSMRRTCVPGGRGMCGCPAKIPPGSTKLHRRQCTGGSICPAWPASATRRPYAARAFRPSQASGRPRVKSPTCSPCVAGWAPWSFRRRCRRSCPRDGSNDSNFHQHHRPSSCSAKARWRRRRLGCRSVAPGAMPGHEPLGAP